jgi:hypothetical protein
MSMLRHAELATFMEDVALALQWCQLPIAIETGSTEVVNLVQGDAKIV